MFRLVYFLSHNAHHPRRRLAATIRSLARAPGRPVLRFEHGLTQRQGLGSTPNELGLAGRCGFSSSLLAISSSRIRS